MSKQVNLDQYFHQAAKLKDLRTNRENRVRKSEECLNITLEQFSECSNIKELITADMRRKMPDKFQRKFILVDKYVKRVYDRYISDSKYREKPLFKNLVFQPKPLHTKRDRELLKQYGISKCFVNMYENNILKYITDSYLQNAIKAHGNEMSEAITKSLPVYVKKILDRYLDKYKTLDRFMRKYKNYSSKIGKVHKADKKLSKFTVGVVISDVSHNVTGNTKIRTLSNQSNCGDESRHSSHLLNVTIAQKEDISEHLFLISAGRCSTQKEVDRETTILPNYALAQEETRREVESSGIWNINGNYERSVVFLDNKNSFENNAQGHFHSKQLNWLEQEYGSNVNKYSIKALTKKLSEAIEMRIKQQYLTAIENIEEVVNKTLICAWDRITRSMEERRDILEFVQMQSQRQGDYIVKSEIKSNVDNTEHLAVELQKIFEQLKENKNIPLPKMLTYNEFKKYTNIEEYLHNDIIKKFPYKTEVYLAKIDKYLKKIFKSYILGSNIWRNGVSFKSKDLLKEFHKKHKPQTVKCDPDADIHRIYTNTNEIVSTNPIFCGESICINNATTCLNRKRKTLSETTDMKSDGNIDTYKKQDGNDITKQVNSPNMHNTQIPMVVIPQYCDHQKTNYDNGTVEKRVFQKTLRNSPGSLLSANCNNLRSPFEETTSESCFNINKKIKIESCIEVSQGNQTEHSLFLAEEENDVAFVSCEQPEFIYISDEPLSSSFLLEEMMRSPPKTAIHPYELPAGFSPCCTENKAEANRMETTDNMNSSDNYNYTEQQASKSLHQNILESSKSAFNLLQNNPHELANNDKNKSYNSNTNENNRRCYGNEQPKIDINVETDKGRYNHSSNKNKEMSYTNFRPNEEEIATQDLGITKYKKNYKTIEASDIIPPNRHTREKKIKQNAEKLAKKEKISTKIKLNTIKIPDLSNDIVAQKVHSFRPLLLIQKSKEFQQDTVQTISGQKDLPFLNDKYNVEYASLVCSTTSEKNYISSTSTTVDLLSKDDSYFLSSQLSPKDLEPLKNPKSRLNLEHVEENSKTPIEGAELISSGTDWERNFIKNINLHITSPSNRPFECITNLILRQINLKSKIDHLNYYSSTPFLQASASKSVEATITVLSSGFNQLRISGPSLHFLFGITQQEWAGFRRILNYLGVFTYNKKQLESEMEPLPYRVLYNFFKTIPSFSQVIFEYEDANINHATCLKFNMQIQKPIIDLEKVIDSYILNSIENLKNKLST